MKITAIRHFVVNAKMRNWIFVRVETDQPGLYGLGEATMEFQTRAVTGAIDDIGMLVIGAVGIVLDRLLAWCEARLQGWQRVAW